MTEYPARVYGVRARLGLVVPSTNTVAETEFWTLAPDGVTVHTARMPFLPDRFREPLAEMERHLSRVMEETVSAEPDIIAYGCTASSAKGDPRDYEAGLTRLAGRRAVSAAGALLVALEALGARRIALVTPYPSALNEKEARFFADNAVEVAAEESVIVDEAQHRMKHMYRVPSDLLVERASALGERDDVDAVVLSCCDMATLEAIPRIEAAIGKPATSSTQALFWRAARAASIDDRIVGRGRLLESF